MADDLHKDNFEKGFKDSFDAQSDLPSEDGWDMPSDQVWEKVEKSIQNQDNSRKGFYWWNSALRGIILLLLIIIGLITGVYFSMENQEDFNLKTSPEMDRVLQEEKTQNDNDQSIVKQNTSEKNSAALNSDQQLNAISDTNSEDKNELASTSNPERISPISKSNPLSPEAKQKVSKNNPKHKTTAPVSQSDNNNSIASTKNESPTIANDAILNKTTSTDKTNLGEEPLDANKPGKRIETLAPLPTLRILATVQNETSDTLALLTTPYFEPEEKDPESIESTSKGLYAGIVVAPTYTYRQLITTGNPVFRRGLNHNESARFSYSFGLNAGYKISDNWSIESGFNYSNLSVQHNTRKQIRYSAIGERMNELGEFERNYRFDLGTSSGDVDADIAIARSSTSSISENEFITLQIQAKQNIQYGSIPLIARYQFGKNKLQFGIKAGIVNRFVLKGTFNIEELRLARTDLRLVMDDIAYRTRPLKNLKQYQADLLIGAGIIYRFNDKIWLTAEPTITRGINPVYETPNFKTYPVMASLDLGFNYLF